MKFNKVLVAVFISFISLLSLVGCNFTKDEKANSDKTNFENIMTSNGYTVSDDSDADNDTIKISKEAKSSDGKISFIYIETTKNEYASALYSEFKLELMIKLNSDASWVADTEENDSQTRIIMKNEKSYVILSYKNNKLVLASSSSIENQATIDRIMAELGY